MADPWRMCVAATTLRNETNTRWPKRDKTSDGGIGDAAHATRTSDHNPFVKKAPPANMGVVRATDTDIDGIDAAWFAEHIRQRGAAGDRRLVGGGYVIFNRRITTQDWRGWKTYTGSNPHTKHVHVSFTLDLDGFDINAPWGIATALASGDDDMSAEAERKIAELHTQLYIGPDPKAPGWPTWPGGSNDRFTVVDYLRKQNQRAEDNARDLGLVRSDVAALVKTVAAIPAAPAPAGAAVALTSADVDRIAAAVVRLRGAKTSA